MADTSGMAEIRGIDVVKAIKGFADEALVLRKFVGSAKASAEEIRYYTRGTGYLDSTDTTAITASQIKLTSTNSRPVIAEQNWTRNTSYVKKYFVESPWIREEDLKGTDVDVFAGNLQALPLAVENQIESDIYTALSTGTGVQTGAATDEWDVVGTCNPILDLLTAEQAIRAYRYKIGKFVLYINSIEYKNLMNYIISVKGSSIPSLATDVAKSGVLMSLLNFDIVVSENATSNQALVFAPNICGTWKSFIPFTTAVIEDKGIGKKIRCWEEGVFLLHDPKTCYLITNTKT